MAMTYKQRQEQGRYKRAVYLNRLNHAEHLATMLRGISLGTGFMFVMFLVAGIDTTADLLILIGVFLIGCVSAIEAEHILFLAEQSRYPKSRRRTFRSEFADEWHEFRAKFSKS